MQPLVSVRVVTYNHEKYIAECLEGILMQRTTFDFEIIVGEHSSSDRTREIVMSYQQKYSDKMRVLITGREESPTQNLLRVQQAGRGVYQALCDGDDYWLDPLKLQKQVDYLEKNPLTTLCFHNAFVTRAKQFNVRYYFPFAMKEQLNFEDIYLLSIPTSSIVGRSQMLNTMPDWRMNIINGDRLIRLWCAHHGPVGYLADVMSVYRKHPTSILHTREKSLRNWYTETVTMCSEFDKDTHFQHTKLLKNMIYEAREYSRRAQWGRIYYLLHPRQSAMKIKNIFRAIQQR